MSTDLGVKFDNLNHVGAPGRSPIVRRLVRNRQKVPASNDVFLSSYVWKGCVNLVS